MSDPVDAAPSTAPLSPSGTMSTAKFPPTLASITFPAPPPLPKTIVSKDDIESNIAAYETLIETASTLRAALAKVAEAENNFGAALQACAKCRGAGESRDGLSSASGLQFLAANHHRILSESFPQGFEAPVASELENYKKLTKTHEEEFQKETIKRTKELRKTEKQNVKLGKKKQRNLETYRSALMDLTNQVDGLEKLKYEYFKYSLDITQDISAKILKQATAITRAEVEMFEGIARKGAFGEGLDVMLEHSEDPFQYIEFRSSVTEEPNTPATVESVLPHESISPSEEGIAQDIKSSEEAAAAAEAVENNYNEDQTRTSAEAASAHAESGASPNLEGAADDWKSSDKAE
ncbi:uncharacterized protein V2V93DRAFT_375235 [Kockiozyma suomiensis]|uniref:uncharacterized protein n=1 Tax=Kockiozyma suomiensis TaxID=1337062 RepID=UPI0033433309